MESTGWRLEPREVAPHPALDDAEREWLARWRVELAAIRPEQLIKRLFRSMHTLPLAAAPGRQEGDAVFVHHAYASDGGGDSFG
jgi:hypothetical protein